MKQGGSGTKITESHKCNYFVIFINVLFITHMNEWQFEEWQKIILSSAKLDKPVTSKAFFDSRVVYNIYAYFIKTVKEITMN